MLHSVPMGAFFNSTIQTTTEPRSDWNFEGTKGLNPLLSTPWVQSKVGPLAVLYLKNQAIKTSGSGPLLPWLRWEDPPLTSVFHRRYGLYACTARIKPIGSGLQTRPRGCVKGIQEVCEVLPGLRTVFFLALMHTSLSRQSQFFKRKNCFEFDPDS